jgi:four helix bundle protein
MMEGQKANIKDQKRGDLKPDRNTKRDDFRDRLYAFTLKLIELIDKLPHDNVGRRLGDQLLRSGTSIMANFVEARAASSRRDYINFFTIALKSANESKLWVSLLKDSGRLKGIESEWIAKEMGEIANILAASIITLKSKKP